MGGNPDIEVLRSNAETVADAYLAQRQPDLTQACGGPYQIAVNYALSNKARNLGYRSSFYYFCWDIYLPYSLKTESGEEYVVLVQLSDRTEGNKHDLNAFRVLRTFLFDDADQLKAQFSNTSGQEADSSNGG